MPTPSKPTSPQPTWAGVSHEIALDLSIRLCRCRRRPTWYGGNTLNAQELGAPVAAWLVVKDTLDFLRGENVRDVPNNADLSKLINVKLNAFGELLKGWMARGNAETQVKMARKVFRHLLIGRDETPADTERERVARYVHEFFFRKSDSEPPFFERERLRHSEPCSPAEVADEILRLVRAYECVRKPAWLIWISGGVPFFNDYTMNEVGGATAEAIKAGVTVSFLFASDATNHDAHNNLKTFEAKFEPVAEGRKYDLAQTRYDEGSDSPIPANFQREFLHPTLRHLYLSIPDDGGTDSTLFMLRGSGKDKERRLPLAIQATDDELGDFERWWNRIRRSTLRPTSERPG